VEVQDDWDQLGPDDNLCCWTTSGGMRADNTLIQIAVAGTDNLIIEDGQHIRSTGGPQGSVVGDSCVDGFGGH